MALGLENLASWSSKRKKAKRKGFNLSVVGGRRIPDEVLEAIIEDAQSGKYPSMRQVAKANSVSPMTVRRYLLERDIEMNKSQKSPN